MMEWHCVDDDLVFLVFRSEVVESSKLVPFL